MTQDFIRPCNLYHQHGDYGLFQWRACGHETMPREKGGAMLARERWVRPGTKININLSHAYSKRAVKSPPSI